MCRAASRESKRGCLEQEVSSLVVLLSINALTSVSSRKTSHGAGRSVDKIDSIDNCRVASKPCLSTR